MVEEAPRAELSAIISECMLRGPLAEGPPPVPSKGVKDLLGDCCGCGCGEDFFCFFSFSLSSAIAAPSRALPAMRPFLRAPPSYLERWSL